MPISNLHLELYRVEAQLTTVSQQLHMFEVWRQRARTEEDRAEVEKAIQKARLLKDYLIWRRNKIRETWDPRKKKRR